MSPQEIALWDKIQIFPIDDVNASFPFSHRLARENGWKIGYAKRVIEEYKKFIFLCCVSLDGVTPSDPVDQAWHLHLTYTRSYWIELCRDTLGKEVHHNPTKGGKSEAQRFINYYDSTAKLYFEKFGFAPPDDIWHNSQRRFSEVNFQRVNMHQYWLISKPTKRVISFGACVMMLLMAILNIQASPFAVIPFLILGMVALCIAMYNSNGGDDMENKRRNGRHNARGDASDGGSSFDGFHDDGHNHHGHSDGHHGCSSGCSGCSSSGCSGCSGCGGD